MRYCAIVSSFALRILPAFFLVMLITTLAEAQQPSGIQLNPNGTSYVYPPFDTSGWTLTRWFGDATHQGDDWYAQDWARGCGETHGKMVFAPISGRVVESGWHNGYGNTAVIYDSESHMALRFAHLLELPVVGLDTDVVAGKTYIGKVGNTGFHAESSCTIYPGAHLHIVMYRHVTDPSLRPVTSVSVSGQPTDFAADFRYVNPAQLVKASQNPTVYAVLGDGFKHYVSGFVFDNIGANFTTFNMNPTFLNPVATWPKGQVNQLVASYYWPPRDGTVVKGDQSQTIFWIDHGNKFAIPSNLLTCPKIQERPIKTVPQAEMDNYPPVANYATLSVCPVDSGGGGQPPPGDFSLGVSPTSSTITAGGTAVYNLGVTSLNNWSGTITASASNLPSGAICNSKSVTLASGSTATLSMSVVTSSTTPTGNFQVTFTCVSGSLVHTVTVTLVINAPATQPGLGLSVSTSQLTVVQGQSTSLLVTVMSINGFVGTVTPYALNLPLNRVISGTYFSPSSSTLGSGGTVNFTFYYNTDSLVTPGTYSVTFVARSGTIESNSVVVTFVIQAPSTPDLYPTSFLGPSSVNAGSSYTYSVGLRNQGTGSAGSFQIGLYLSLDSSTTGSRIGYASVGGLAAGGSTSVTVVATFPSNLSGNLWLKTVVDDQGQVAESNEGNNRWDYGWVYINPTTVSPIAWEFNSGNTEGWGSYNLAAYVFSNGNWIMDPNAGDYYLTGPSISASASSYRYVVVRMASNATDNQGYIYYKTSAANFYSEDKKVFFQVNNCYLCGNAPFYTYNIYMAGQSQWTGTITGIRLDPSYSGTGGTNLDSMGIDYIRLVQAP